MPRYDYECPECGIFEVYQSIHDKKLKICEECGSKIKRLLSAVSFSIKGANANNGYYIPPTNEELGLPSERECMKNLQENEYYVQETQLGRKLTQQEKEIIKDEQKQLGEAALKEKKRIEQLKEKHPEFTDKVQKTIEKEKKLPEWKKRKRKENREHGTRAARKDELKDVYIPQTSKIFKDK